MTPTLSLTFSWQHGVCLESTHVVVHCTHHKDSCPLKRLLSPKLVRNFSGMAIRVDAPPLPAGAAKVPGGAVRRCGTT